MGSAKRWGVGSLALLMVLSTLLVQGLAIGEAHAGIEKVLRVGESITIFLGRIKTVSVGNPNVIEAKQQGDKIVVFAVRPGYSSLTVGEVDYDITVLGDVERLRRDIETLLIDIPGVEVLTSGERVVIDGIVKRRDDFERIQGIVTSNPADVYSLVLLDERDIVRKAQIQLHFQVLEVNRNREHDIGLDWSGNGPIRLVLDTINYVQFGLGGVTDPLGVTRVPDDLLDLSQETDVRRVLDKDFFTTVSGEEVLFQRGKTLIFTATNNVTGAANFFEREIGLLVTATPIIDDDGVAVGHRSYRPLGFDAVTDARLAEATRREVVLLLRDRRGRHAAAVLARGVYGERSPTRADLQEVVVRLQVELLAQPVDLGDRGFAQRRVLALVDAAGVRHRLVEEQGEEVVGEVVVVGDRLGVGFLVVLGACREDFVILIRQRRRQLIANAHDFADRAFQFQTAFNKGAAQEVETGVSEIGHQRRVLDDNRDAGVSPQFDFIAIPKLESQW